MVAPQVARSMAKDYLRGFTLIELLIVMAIVAILATIAYPTYIGLQERAKITKDMSNLRQIGIATQLYMNDNNGALPGSATVPPSWMSQLYPKYISAWSIFISPFDTPSSPRTASDNSATSALSYGINANVYPPPSGVAISADKITKPTVFIVFAAAQDSSSTVEFRGTANTTPPQTNLAGSLPVTVAAAASSPGGPATGGTNNNRTKISAVFADWHVETMPWTTFTNTTQSPADPDANLRWTPYTPYP
jgi:prepilin-type N-terminal cleavage/methylation domain-containing protein